MLTAVSQYNGLEDRTVRVKFKQPNALWLTPFNPEIGLPRTGKLDPSLDPKLGIRSLRVEVRSSRNNDLVRGLLSDEFPA